MITAITKINLMNSKYGEINPFQTDYLPNVDKQNMWEYKFD